MEKVSKIKVENGLKDAILKAIAPLGGLENFIKKGEVVLLKPNFNTADPFPASTDFEFLKTLVELIYELEPKMVLIGESSTMSLNTRKIMEKLGIFKLEKMEKSARIYVFEEWKWLEKEIPQGKYLKKVSLTEILERPDKLILLPCLKTHKYAQFTGSLKLAMGFMKPFQRVGFHLKNLQEKIAELNSLICPDLIIMDARKCFIAGGPSSGKLAELNLILASKSRIAIDVEGIRIIQSFKGNSLSKIDPFQLPQIKRAIELGIK